MSNVRRSLSVLCLFVFLGVFLGMPLAAQAESRPLSPFASFAPLSGLLSSAWEHLTTPLASLWAADEVPVIDLTPPLEIPPPEGDSRGGWDPEG